MKKTIYEYDGQEFVDYVEIANARIKHYKENEYVQIDLFEIGE